MCPSTARPGEGARSEPRDPPRCTVCRQETGDRLATRARRTGTPSLASGARQQPGEGLAGEQRAQEGVWSQGRQGVKGIFRSVSGLSAPGGTWGQEKGKDKEDEGDGFGERLMAQGRTKWARAMMVVWRPAALVSEEPVSPSADRGSSWAIPFRWAEGLVSTAAPQPAPPYTASLSLRSLLGSTCAFDS